MSAAVVRDRLRRITGIPLGVAVVAATLVIIDGAAGGASSSDFAIDRLSDTALGVQGDGASTQAVISDDATTVVFVSSATNLVTPATTGQPEIFALDRATGVTELISRRPDGSPANVFGTAAPRVSADGRYVAFVSNANGLVDDDTNDRADVFVRDREADTTTRVSADDAPYTFYGPPNLSDDGATVVVFGGGPGVSALLEGEWQTQPLTPVPGIPGPPTFSFSLSGDATTIALGYEDAEGRRVGFYDRATDSITDSIEEDDADPGQFTVSDDGTIAGYVIGEPFDTQQLKLWERSEDTPVIVADWSFDQTEVSNPWLSGDGTTLVYDTYLEECVTGFGGDCTEGGSIYDHDVESGLQLIVSRPCDGCGEGGSSRRPSADETGEHLVFDSSSLELVGDDDLNDVRDVFHAIRLGNEPPVFDVGDVIVADTIGATFVDVSWSEATDDDEVTGYELFVGSSSVGTTSGDVQTFTITDLEPDTTITLGVEAVDVSDQRSDRLELDVTTLAGVGAGAASLSGSATSATTARLAWDPADPAGLTGYRVFRADGGAFSAVGDVDASATVFDDMDLDPSTTYRYRVGRLDGDVIGAHTVERELDTPAVTVDRIEFRTEQVGGTPLAVLGATARLEADGAPGLDVTAVVSFDSWFDESDPPLLLAEPAPRTLEIDLPQRPFGLPGRYLAEFPIIDGISEITSFDVTMQPPVGDPASASDRTLPLAVSAGVRVEIDAPPDAFGTGGPGEAWTLRSTGTITPDREQTVTGGGTIHLSGFLAAELIDVELLTAWDTEESTVSDQAVVAGRFIDVVLTPRPAASLFFEVSDVDGSPLDGARIEIFDDETGVLRGTRFTGPGGPGRSFPEFDDALAGDSLRLEVTGATIDPQTRVETVIAGEQTVSFSALGSLRGTVRGTVFNDDGSPARTTVVIVQNEERRTTETEPDGTFEFDAAPGPATITAGSPTPQFSGEGIVVQTVDVPEPPDEVVVELRTRGVFEYTLRIDVFVVEPDGSTTGPEIDDSVSELGFTGPGNRQYGQARPTFVAQARRGTVGQYCVISTRRGLGQDCVDVEFGEERDIEIEFRLEPAAGVTGTLTDRAGAPVIGSTWTGVVSRPGSPGDFTSTAAVRGVSGRSELRLFVPEAGTWTVTIVWSDPNTQETLLAEVPITVTDGQEIDLGLITPTDDGRFGAGGNAVRVEPPRVLPGESARIRVNFVNDLADTDDASMVVPIPKGTTIDLDGTILNGLPVTATVDAQSNLIVPIGDLDPGEAGVIAFHLLVDDPDLGDVPLAPRVIHADATPGGDLVGVGILSVARVTLVGRSRTATGTVPLVGRAPAGATVTITDADEPIATVVASAGGRWQTTVELDQLAQPLEHELVASVAIGGVEVRSVPLFVGVDPAWPEPRRATLDQTGRVQSWDPRQGVASFPFSYYLPESVPSLRPGVRWPASPLVVTVEFDDPTQIRWLAVTIGDETQMATLQDGVWTASLIPFELGDVFMDYDVISLDRQPADLPPVIAAELRRRIPVTAALEVTGVTTGVDGGRVNMTMPLGPDTITIRDDALIERDVPFTPTGTQLTEADRAGLPSYVEDFEYEESEDGLTGTIGFDVYLQEDYLDALLIEADEDEDGGSLRAARSVARDAATSNADGPSVFVKARYDISLLLAPGAVGTIQAGVDAVQGGGKYQQLDAILSALETCEALSTEEYVSLVDRVQQLITDAAWIDAAGVIGQVAGVALTFANPIVGFVANATLISASAVMSARLELSMAEITARLGGLGCVVGEDPSASPRWIFDPSGFVFEGVESNRIEGATATVVEGATETGPFVEWDAVPYGQVNPLITETDGSYGWDVPEGWWQVRYTKAGHLPATSDVLRVLPPHFDVDVGMIPVAAPTVNTMSATSGPSGVDVTFSTYMDPATVDIEVTGLAGAIVPVDPEPDPDGRVLARSYRFVPTTSLTPGDDVVATVAAGIDFAGRPITAQITRTISVAPASLAPVTGSVFSDLDRSGVRVDEPGLVGVSVDITDTYGRTLRTETGPGGTFSIEVPIGPIDVVVVADSASLTGLASTVPSLAQRIVVPDGGATVPGFGFAAVAGAIAPLVVSASSSVVVDEGATVDVVSTVAGTVAPVVVAFDLDGDGRTDSSTAERARFDAGDEDGPATRSVELIATDGRRSGSATVQIEVRNVAPSVTAADIEVIGAQVSEQVVARFADPAPGDTHTARIDWGDGTTPRSAPVDGGVVRAAHSFAIDGSYTVEVCVTDDDGGVGCTTTVVSASQTAPPEPPATAAPKTPGAPAAPPTPVDQLPSTGSTPAIWLRTALVLLLLGVALVSSRRVRVGRTRS